MSNSFTSKSILYWKIVTGWCLDIATLNTTLLSDFHHGAKGKLTLAHNRNLGVGYLVQQVYLLLSYGPGLIWNRAWCVRLLPTILQSQGSEMEVVVQHCTEVWHLAVPCAKELVLYRLELKEEKECNGKGTKRRKNETLYNRLPTRRNINLKVFSISLTSQTVPWYVGKEIIWVGCCPTYSFNHSCQNLRPRGQMTWSNLSTLFEYSSPFFSFNVTSASIKASETIVHDRYARLAFTKIQPFRVGSPVKTATWVLRL